MSGREGSEARTLRGGGPEAARHRRRYIARLGNHLNSAVAGCELARVGATSSARSARVPAASLVLCSDEYSAG